MSKHTKASVMEQAQVFASAWSLVGGIFDSGYALDDAEEAKRELAEMVGSVVQQRDELLAALIKADAVVEYLTPIFPTDDVQRISSSAREAARAAIAAAEGREVTE